MPRLTFTRTCLTALILITLIATPFTNTFAASPTLKDIEQQLKALQAQVDALVLKKPNAQRTTAGEEVVPLPTITLTASPDSVLPNTPVTLTWESANTSSCTAKGGWSGTKPLTGSETVTPAASVTYFLTCTSNINASTTEQRVRVYVSNLPQPVEGRIHFEDFENQPVNKSGVEVLSTEAKPSGFRWGDQVATKVSSEQAKSGSKSLRFNYRATPSGSDSWSEQRFSLGAGYTDLWVSWDMYLPLNYKHRPDPPSSNNKFLALWSKSYQDYGQQTVYQLWPQADTENSSIDASGHPRYGSGQAPLFDVKEDLGKWTKVIMHWKRASGTSKADGVIEMFHVVDGKIRTVLSDTAVANWGPDAGLDPLYNFISHGYLLGWSNSGFTEQTQIYLDNVEFSTLPPSELNLPKTEPRIVIHTPQEGQTVSGSFKAVASMYFNDAAAKGASVAIDGKTVVYDYRNGIKSFAQDLGTAGYTTGPHTLTFTAEDENGQKISKSVQVNFANSGVTDAVQPNISVTAPVEGNTYDGSKQLTVRVTATDNVAMKSVQFALDGSFVSTSRFLTTRPSTLFTTPLRNLKVGPHEITAIAMDTAGNTNTQTVRFNVSNSASEVTPIPPTPRATTTAPRPTTSTSTPTTPTTPRATTTPHNQTPTPATTPVVTTPTPEPPRSSGGGGGGGSTKSKSDRYQTTAILNVRSAPGITAPSIGIQQIGTIGILKESPVTKDGHTWYHLNYDTGADGWSTNLYLKKITSTETKTDTKATVTTKESPRTSKSCLTKAKFTKNTKILITKAKTPVRDTPNGTILKGKKLNAQGTITKDPTCTDTTIWYYVDFKKGTDGYVRETRVKKR